MISLLFTGVFITSVRMKNCSRLQWTARRSTTARSDCRAWTTSGSNLGTTAIKSAFIVYADLEFYGKQNKEDTSSYTYQQHEVFSTDYYVRCSYNNALSSHRFRRDEDCIAWFARQLNDLAYRMKNIVFANMPMETLSKEQ